MALFPRSLDGDYRGHWLAPWLFGLVVLMRAGIALNTAFNTRDVAQRADGIPLSTYPAAAAQTIVALFGIWGVAQLVLALVAIVVLVRYRGALGLMFLALIADHVGRMLVLHAHPIVHVGAPPGGMINRAVLGAMVVGLGLAMWERRPKGRA